MTVQTNMPTSSAQFLYRLFHDVLPSTRSQIAHWTTRATAIPDETLRYQALASLTEKRFHADGGCVYAAFQPLASETLIKLIVALQTISDYLDNLCDRCDVYNPEDFRQLHQAMHDAITPDAVHKDYYRFRPDANDGGYLDDLVTTCQQSLHELPRYDVVQPRVDWLIQRYCELQEHKHIDPPLRVQTLKLWWSEYQSHFPDMAWYEFAAATGSTLGVFSLFLAATLDCSRADRELLYNSYFPWICGLHILLDYLIDLDEDKRVGDFNFVECYGTAKEARRRIRYFAAQSFRRAKRIPLGGAIHRYVVQGLLGMYLSDAKVAKQPAVRKTRRVLWTFGPTTWMFYAACCVYRNVR